MKKIALAIVLLVLFASSVYIAFGRGSGTPATPAAPAASTATATNETVLAEGRVVPVNSVQLSFPASGVVAEVLVNEGDTVQQGAPLARLDTRTLELQVAQAQAALAQAKASYDMLIQQASPEEIAVREAQLAQAEASLREARGSVTAQDIAAARATLAQARATLAELEAGPKNTQVQAAQATLDQAQANLQTQRDTLSANKTSAELQMQQATADLTTAQSAYATAKSNWEYIQDTGNDPIVPNTVGADGKAKANKLNDAQRQQYYDALTQAEAAMRSAESAVQQAQVRYDNARQAEITGIQSAEAQVQSAQATLDQTRSSIGTDQLAAARAQVAQAQANLDKLTGEQRSGTLDAASAGVASAEANLAAVQAEPRAPDMAYADAQVQAAEASLRTAQLAVEQATLTAPFSGTVVQVNLNPGEIPGIASPAIILADTSAWQIETTDLTELSVGKIAVGDPASMSFEALPDLELDGTITRIASIGENKQGDIVFTVTITPTTSAPQLHWNMTATVRISSQ